MNCVFAARRVLDPDVVVEKFAGYVVIDLADRTAEFEARLDPRLLAAICGDRAAGRERAGLGLDIDDPGAPQPILRRQRAGNQRDGIGKPRLERLAEHVDPFRQLNPVQPILQIGVVAADMDLSKRILRDARCLQQQLVQGLVIALRLSFDRLPAKIVDGGAEPRLDLSARNVELLGDHFDIQGQAAFRDLLGCCGAGK